MLCTIEVFIYLSRFLHRRRYNTAGSQSQLFLEIHQLGVGVLHHPGKSLSEDAGLVLVTPGPLATRCWHLGSDGDGGDLEVRRSHGVELGQLLLGGSVTQTAHLERLCSLNEGREAVLGHVGLPLVHVLHQALEIVKLNVLHDDDGVLVIEERGLEQLLKYQNVKIIVRQEASSRL